MTGLPQLAAQRDRMVDEVRALVACESPSSDSAATSACAKVLEDIAAERIGIAAERLESGGCTHLRWTVGKPRVLLLGHLDTVWPLGTTDRWPIHVDGDRMTGPGVFDMKAGLVQLFAALSTLDDREGLDGIAVLVTSDEEIGGTTSQRIIEETARGLDAVLVLEPSADGALKVARKGVATYRLEITGRAAHAGLEPHNGINAGLELAHQVLAIAALGRPDIGTTVTPTTLAAGTTVNTVPAAATISVDVRAESAAEMDRVVNALSARAPVVDGADVAFIVDATRPPLERTASEQLFALTRQIAVEIGLPAPDGVAVGGGSDGNFTAALGVPTLDGLGAIGGGAHADGEWASVTGLSERAALLAAVTQHLQRNRGEAR